MTYHTTDSCLSFRKSGSGGSGGKHSYGTKDNSLSFSKRKDGGVVKRKRRAGGGMVSAPTNPSPLAPRTMNNLP